MYTLWGTRATPACECQENIGIPHDMWVFNFGSIKNIEKCAKLCMVQDIFNIYWDHCSAIPMSKKPSWGFESHDFMLKGSA